MGGWRGKTYLRRFLACRALTRIMASLMGTLAAVINRSSSWRSCCDAMLVVACKFYGLGRSRASRGRVRTIRTRRIIRSWPGEDLDLSGRMLTRKAFGRDDVDRSTMLLRGLGWLEGGVSRLRMT